MERGTDACGWSAVNVTGIRLPLSRAACQRGRSGDTRLGIEYVSERVSTMLRFFLLFGFAMVLPFVASARTAPEESASFQFRDDRYFHRWSSAEQHEFTPEGQEDLAKWTDMVTIHRYLNVTDGEQLAATANAILGNYRRARGMVVRTSSLPRTEDRPAEHLLVVLFPTPEYIEAAFTRLKLSDGVGTSTVYSHREYGKKIGDRMSAWLKENGVHIEKALMAWEGNPNGIADVAGKAQRKMK